MPARCEDCRQFVHPTPEGVACACQRMDTEAIRALLQAYARLPDPWPVLDLLDLLDAEYHDCSRGTL